jgi:hypothetical protein
VSLVTLFGDDEAELSTDTLHPALIIGAEEATPDVS